MKVMVIVKATKASEAGELPGEQILSDMIKFNEELVNSGIMLSGDGLTPSSKGARVVFKGDERLVVDGPFAETKEVIAGYWVWKVKDMAEAIAWAKRCPHPHPGTHETHLEIRPFFEDADFGEAFTPELRAKEAELRVKAEAN